MTAQRSDAHARASKLRSDIEMYRSHARANRARAEEMGKALRADDPGLRQKELRALADRGLAKAAELASVLHEVEREIAEMDQRESELREQMLVP